MEPDPTWVEHLRWYPIGAKNLPQSSTSKVLSFTIGSRPYLQAYDEKKLAKDKHASLFLRTGQNKLERLYMANLSSLL
jgi:hypothetical protein